MSEPKRFGGVSITRRAGERIFLRCPDGSTITVEYMGQQSRGPNSQARIFILAPVDIKIERECTPSRPIVTHEPVAGADAPMRKDHFTTRPEPVIEQRRRLE